MKKNRGVKGYSKERKNVKRKSDCSKLGKIGLGKGKVAIG